MKLLRRLAFLLAGVMLLVSCSEQVQLETPADSAQPNKAMEAVAIVLNDQTVTVDGEAIGSNAAEAVYKANDIVYYESDKDFTYGEGTAEDAHTAWQAAEHTVVHINQAGTYRVSGKLSKGQIAVDLGENASQDPQAVVTLILDGVDLTCEVAPAVIFYNVYECGNTENPTKDVDTTNVGAQVILVDGTQNTVRGSYVARIYKPDTVVLNQEGTAVEDAKKWHKYDGAFYSKMSMTISGETENNGQLAIYAENEGLDSEMHLTINSGIINIFSGNDGINTNEDGVSVTTINGGQLNIQVTGETGEGDGIDSNGWLVINGGTVTAWACSDSADAGIDSDMGIHINGGTVMASGHMLDRIEQGGQTYGVFTFAQKQNHAQTICLRDSSGNDVMTCCPPNTYSVLLYSSPALQAGDYTLWSGEQQLAGQAGGTFGNMGMPPEGIQPPQGMQPPEGAQPPDGLQPPDGMEPPNGNHKPNGQTNGSQDASNTFTMVQGGNQFSGISLATQ